MYLFDWARSQFCHLCKFCHFHQTYCEGDFNASMFCVNRFCDNESACSPLFCNATLKFFSLVVPFLLSISKHFITATYSTLSRECSICNSGNWPMLLWVTCSRNIQQLGIVFSYMCALGGNSAVGLFTWCLW